MRRHAPFEPTDPNSCIWGGVHDVINCANFFENRSRGLGAGIPRKNGISDWKVHRPYNSVPCCTVICWKVVNKQMQASSMEQQFPDYSYLRSFLLKSVYFRLSKLYSSDRPFLLSMSTTCGCRSALSMSQNLGSSVSSRRSKMSNSLFTLSACDLSACV